MARSFGLAARVQGMKRFYALLLGPGPKARLIKALDGDHVLDETDFDWQFDAEYQFDLQVAANRIKASIDGTVLFDIEDTERPLDGGGIALVCEEGHIRVDDVRVQP
jgi:hypothetical protein